MIHFDISNDFVAIKYQGGSAPFCMKIYIELVFILLIEPKGVLNKVLSNGDHIKNMVGLVCDLWQIYCSNVNN